MSSVKGGADRKVSRSGSDFYPTPEYAVDLFLEKEKFTGVVWEPACGNGAICRVLERRNIPFIASDLYDYGFGKSGVDFFRKAELMREKGIFADEQITNPPFKYTTEWIEKSLKITARKLALFLPLRFLESAERFEKIFSRCRPSRVYVFVERVTLYPEGKITGGSSTIAFCWAVWDELDKEKSHRITEVRWLSKKYVTS